MLGIIDESDYKIWKSFYQYLRKKIKLNLPIRDAHNDFKITQGMKKLSEFSHTHLYHILHIVLDNCLD